MYKMMRLHHDGLKKSLKILEITRRCYSQQILSPKPKLTRVFCNSRNVPCSLEGLKKYFSTLSSLRSNVCTYNERIVGKKKLHNLAWREGQKTSALDVNTAVVNNVMLYKYEKPGLFRFINLFAPVQCIFWCWVSYYVYKLLPERAGSLWEYFKENWVWVIISGSALFLGTTSMVLMWTFSSRSIKYIILKPGGKDVTFVTYQPWKKDVGVTVPLKCVSSRMPRKEMINYMPIKLRGHSFFYVVESGGEFVNPKLYDHTIGIARF